jgi:hypothetical protein
MLLEAGNQAFPSALTGFDIVSSSFNGDKDDRHIARAGDARINQGILPELYEWQI